MWEIRQFAIMQKWKDIRINMDTLCANKKVDTSLNEFLENHSDIRFFAGPVGAVNLHYGEKYNDASYNEVLVSACAKAGIAAMTGDGVNADVMKCATEAIKKLSRHWNSDCKTLEFGNG